MLSEGRKRDAANALLGIAFAANAAQSPEALISASSQKDVQSGVQLMSRMMQKRKEANRNLDSARVSHPARNKTFKEFVEEAYLIEGQSREDAEKKRQQKENPDEWRVRNIGGGRWTTKRKKAISSQGVRRTTGLKPLSYSEVLSWAKRNLKPNPEQYAKNLINKERARKSSQTREARKKTTETGERHTVDHPQPISQNRRRPENRERFERITPRDVSYNRSVMPSRENESKNSKSPKKGEPGYGKTRSGSIRKLSLESTSQKLAQRSAELIKSGKNPEVYKNLLRKALNRLNPKDDVDYPGREAARKDKHLIPSGRTSSFPELAGVSTRTKNPKKLRKQRALGELT